MSVESLALFFHKYAQGGVQPLRYFFFIFLFLIHFIYRRL